MASVLCVNQSSDGYLWIGTDGAELIRFDGQTFVEIHLPGQNNNHHIENISFDNSNVHFSSRYKGFFEYSPRKDTIIKLNNALKIGEALGVYRKEELYYFVGSRSVYLRNGDDYSELIRLKSNQSSFTASNIIEAPRSVFIFNDNTCYRLVDGKAQKLNDWLNSSVDRIEEFQFGYPFEDKIIFTTKKADRWLEVNVDEFGELLSFKELNTPRILDEEESVISLSFNPKCASGGILTNAGSIYSFSKKKLKVVAHNYTEALDQVQRIYTDFYGDFWIVSGSKGMYKVSLEPFTKIEMDETYQSGDISMPHRTVYGDIILSTYNNETFVGTLFERTPFKKFDFTVKAIQVIDGVYYIGSNTGIRLYHPSDYPNFEIAYLKNQNITFLLADGNTLWVGIAGKGLHQLNVSTGEITIIKASEIELPQFFYTGEISNNQQSVYFGTNNGIYIYSKKDHVFSRLQYDLPRLGSYSGVSTKDIYGNSWFTTEGGLVGVDRQERVVVIEGDEYFKSTLFYTLNSDQLGNLIVGTNKGITILNMTEDCSVSGIQHYDDESGFLGYETNMRSQFQSGNSIFVGTIEGLFLINTEMLQERKTPLPPIVSHLGTSKHFNSERSTGHDEDVHPLSFEFHVNHPRAGSILYSYRIVGSNTEWIELEEKTNNIQIHGLSNGQYELEVRASYDGINYSDSTIYPFYVNLPIWKSNWFIIVLTIIVVGLNIFLLNYYKSIDSGKLMSSKDIVVHLRMTPIILIFSAIIVPASEILAPVLVPDLTLNLAKSLTIGFILFTLYFLSLSAKNTNKTHLYDTYLKIGFILVMADYMWEVYASHLHPFNIIGVVLISMMAPYILSKIKSTIIFALVILSIAICFVSILDDTIYPKTYFMIAMFVMSALTIFSSYLRYDSLEKLIFISSIINKGNIPAIAFNDKGVVTYASENISNFAEITHDEILGNNISILNNFVPFGDEFKSQDVVKDFVDGEKYLVPMENGDQEVHWLEWSYKVFGNNIRVLLGRDISEKMELENTYELLVQNAEDFIYRCDINGNFVFLNQICFTKLGYTKEELVGRFSLELIDEAYREEAAGYYESHFSQNKSSSYREFPIRKKNGEIIWIGQYVTTLYKAGSNSYITGFIAMARDITEIREQQYLIKDQRDAITSSINYARRIQYNLLPQEQQFEQNFEQYFIISKPKDIVSGDFYWMQKIHDKTVLVLADCTGHGVPGSFMTLLGFNLLNSVVLENGVTDPATILNDLDKKLKEYLPKGEGENTVNDGMEVTVCVFSDKSNELAYACAGSRFLVYDKSGFTMFKGDNKHIGDEEESFNRYNSHYTNFGGDYNLFLFSDGFQDQFGGPKDKKYSFRRLLELFESNIHLPLSEQQKMIESDFEQWIGKSSQTDDVTVISVKPEIK
ncbi:MAG: PAS domain S-box protein [Crocinitomicaceae bacterium]|nr:PAS domain S-box protein [Crocinitomicaceae bacterium]